MLTTIFYFFLAYLAYMLIVRVIIPIWRTTRRVRRAFREAQQQMNQHMNAGQPHDPAPKKGSRVHTSPQPQKGDYIDFEEVKD